MNCCSSLLKDCLALIDSEASSVLKSEDLEDLDISALKTIVCRETLNLNSETDVYDALWRWSTRECKRQKRQLTHQDRRAVLEGAQYLVRYLTLNKEEFIKSCALLDEEEQDALMALICQGNKQGGIAMPGLCNNNTFGIIFIDMHRILDKICYTEYLL